MADEIDIISPRFIGSDMIGITVDAASEPLLAGRPITLDFNYARTAPSGVVLPLLFQVQPAFGRGDEYSEHTFSRNRPSSFAFIVSTAGQYLVVLRECGHNSWQGRLLIEVGGEKFSRIQSTRQEP